MAQTYSYKVRDKDGKVITGTLEAETEEAVSQKLRQMGYFVVGIERQRESFAKKEISLFKPKIKMKDVCVFTRQFATMINAGLPLVRCLSVLAEQTDNPSLAETILDLQHEVEMGRSLSEAMAKHRDIFNDLYVSMVKAGEIGGVLDDVLLRVANTLENDMELKHKIKSAMTYPVALLGLSMLLLVAMLLFVVPIFEKMFDDMGAELPAVTKVVVALSKFVASWKGAIFIALLVVGIVMLKRWTKTEKGVRAKDRVMLKLPVFGPLFHKVSMSRFARTLGTLVSSGVPILQALEITSDAVGNKIIGDEVDGVRVSVKEGESIAKPLSSSALFPPMLTQMLAIGEETGALDTMLNKVSDFYDSEVTNTVESLTALLEPIMMMFLGGVVGGLVIALYLPIFSLVQQVG